MKEEIQDPEILCPNGCKVEYDYNGCSLCNVASLDNASVDVTGWCSAKLAEEVIKKREKYVTVEMKKVPFRVDLSKPIFSKSVYGKS